jgi:predicted secreted protein
MAAVSAAVGEVVELAVEELPGAGYRWVVREVPDGVVLVDEVLGAPPSPPGLVGGVARRTLRFRVDQPGSHRLELVLVRPWEPPEVPPARRRIVTVTATAPAAPPA